MQWIYRYIIFHNKRHPKDMGVPEIEAFLTGLIGACRGLKIGLSSADKAIGGNGHAIFLGQPRPQHGDRESLINRLRRSSPVTPSR